MLFVQTNLRGMGLGWGGLLPAKEGGEQALPGWVLKRPSAAVIPSCPASTDRLLLCHCNWHSNHSDGCSPGMRARGPRRAHADTVSGRKGDRQPDYRQAQIRLSLHCKWLRLWALRTGAGMEQCRDMNDDKEPRRRYGGAIYQAYWISALPRGTGFFPPFCGRI